MMDTKTSVSNKIAEILLVEDNPGDVILLKKAFTHSQMPSRLHVANNGDEALEYLENTLSARRLATPDIILLDLNLPRKGGIEVLRAIKSSPSFRYIPVIILTSSQAEADILQSYNSYANSYILKPTDGSGYGTIISGVEDFWFSLVVLADQPAGQA